MKCPSCGSEIGEGKLYCEICGTEIRIVPDFEPEIENSITETLSTVAEEIEGKQQPPPQIPAPKKSSSRKIWPGGGEEGTRNWLPASLLTFVVVMIVVAFVSVSTYHRYSPAYQIEQARKYASEENYEQAVKYLERARTLQEDSVDIALLESNYYYQMGEKQKALNVLSQLVDRNELKYDETEKVYENIIAIYAEEGNYAGIHSLLLACEDLEIQTHFQQYLALAPEFGYESGNYNEVIPLKISANTTGRIYYTLDGSEPDESSLVYTAPLILESGEYQIAAVFINDYGIKSEVVRKWYLINLAVPEPPEVLLESGEYNTPTRIEVTGIPEEGAVYYTVDGSEPTRDSLNYTGPIEMPLGKTNFKFIAISKEGVSSEVVSRSFDLDLHTDVSVSKAIANVVQALFDRKVLTDLQGNSHGIQGKYVFVYDTIVEIPDLGYYYVLNEYIEDENGLRTQTEHLYAVEVYTGAPNRLIYDEEGNMGLISLQSQDES